MLKLLDQILYLESERAEVLEKTEKVKALVERALKYNKDLILDTDS